MARVLRGPSVDVPLPGVSLGKYVFSRLLELGDAPAQVYPLEDSRKVSFLELARGAACVAAELKARGVGPGDVVAIGCRVTSEFSPLLVGALLRCAIPAPFNPDLDKEELQLVLQTLRPRLVVSQEPALSALEAGVSLEQVGSWLQGDARPAEALSSLAAEDPPDWADSCAVILCSSGTTGPPKGVMLSHRSILTLCVLSKMVNAQRNSSPPALSTSPIFWVSGLLVQMNAMCCGQLACILPTFEEDAVARILSEYKIKDVFMPPNVAVSLAKNRSSPLRKYLSELEALIVAGSVMDAETQLFVEKELGKRVTQWYGMTESMIALGSMQGDIPPPGSCGKLLMNVEAKVLDLETDEPVGPDVEGELCLRARTSALGYWNNPEATAAAWSADGWFRTGDVVHYDRRGYFYVVDRVKQLIKFRGHHVLSPQLESLLLAHPAVRLAAVVGKPHPTDQEHPTAFVVLRPGHSATPAELQRLVDDKVSDHKRLRGGVRIVSALPHTASGKPAKRVLRRWAAATGADVTHAV